ncbi:BatD family protein [Geomonas sp. RF6]|uniref:BatD family protein n=1 Tax=Geomonas sp. RF6 TaxID=2897342 RepID=UPI001E57F886|nr:BatD family protein [Geomonas sp. RF6]UFS69554.1 BatD family protein [Geomonas sp. RF6]
MEVRAAKTQVYPGEPLSVVFTLLVDGVQVRNIQYPRIKAGRFSMAPFGLPVERHLMADGRDVAAYDFATTVTALRPGVGQLGPAELRCEILAAAAGSGAFFGGMEGRAVTVTSDPHSLVVLDFPAAGRPPRFSGAVGSFTVARSAAPQAVAVGDPVTVRTVIRGVGNVDAFSCEPVSAPGFHAYPPRRSFTGGAVACEQVLVPETPAVHGIPPAEISFFDPSGRGYRTVETPLVPLTVTAAPLPRAEMQPPPAAPLAIRPTYTSRYGEAAAASLLAATAAGLFLFCRRSHSTLEHPAPPGPDRLAEAAAALAGKDVEAFYSALFRVVQHIAATRSELASAGIAAPPVGTEDDLAPLFSRCDRVRYGQYQPDVAEMSNDYSAAAFLLSSSSAPLKERTCP